VVLAAPMANTSGSVGLGRLLFRFRSFTPVPVLVLLAVLLWRSRGEPGPGGLMIDSTLDALGLVVALMGQALRFYTLGLVPEGTSGQGSVLEATTLNTRGPYAYVRNPLYVGNLGIVLGLLLIAHDPWVYVIGLLFFFGEYFFIIRAEEAFLHQRFGDRYDEFRARVRRWVPRLTPAYTGQLRSRFDLGRALKKEHNPFAAWASGAILLLAWERFARHSLTPAAVWTLVLLEAAVLVVFVGIKGWKHRWLAPRSS
jgi:protein-S-isoprenylcysteine O-methyltransferase Ste14